MWRGLDGVHGDLDQPQGGVDSGDIGWDILELAIMGWNNLK